MNKKWYLVAAAVVVLAAALGGWRWYCEATYYRLVQQDETSARAFMANFEAENRTIEKMTLATDNASASNSSAAADHADAAAAQANLHKASAYLGGDASKLAAWKHDVQAANNQLASLWVSRAQAGSLHLLNTQQLSLIASLSTITTDTNDALPAMQEVLHVLNAESTLSAFGGAYATVPDMQAHFDQLATVATFSAAGYRYPGEATVKVKYPEVNAAILSLDRFVGDGYTMYRDIDRNDLAGALSLASKLQSEAGQLQNEGMVMNKVGKATFTAPDKAIVAAVSGLRSDVAGSTDKKFAAEVGLRKYAALELAGALDMYSYDHEDAQGNNTYPAGNLASAVRTLIEGKYLDPDFATVSTMTYTTQSGGQAYELTYVDDVTGQHVVTGD